MINLLRSVLAIVLGYAIFVASTLAVFKWSGQEAHAPASLSFMALSSGVGVLAAFIGGYMSAIVAGRKPMQHALATATLLATGAIVSLISTIGKGAIWSQISALALMAPSMALGGWMRARGERRAS